MTKTIISCDHCEKELDPMIDYVDGDIDIVLMHTKADLCEDCFAKLNEMVFDFCTKKGGD